MSQSSLRTWIIVNKSCLQNNYQLFRKLIGPKVKLMAIAKSNAYGFGLWDYVKTMVKLGVDCVGVDSIAEALTLRRSKITKPILVLGYTLPNNFSLAVKNNISLTISSFENLAALKKLPPNKKKLKIHLKIDTGMHRQGFLVEQLPKVIKILKQLNTIINVEGVYTHFSSAKDPKKPQKTLSQIKKFQQAVKILEKAGVKPLKHASASGGTLLYPQAHFNLVRVGIGLLGYWPSTEIKNSLAKKINLQPALSWKTLITETKEVPKGEGIGYDLTEILQRRTLVGMCPVGYWHGLSRKLSSNGYVLVQGKRAKILGRVSMDMITIDLTEIKNVKVGDEVTILGKDQKEEITVEEWAKLLETINYEVITRINPLIKRIYT